MDDLKKLKIKINLNKIFVIFLIITISHFTSYGYWYEEPEIYETKNVDDMWWLRKKQRDELKQKQENELKKKIEEDKKKEFKDKKMKWLYSDSDTTNFAKNKWELIDDDNDGKYYKYYFDTDGYLLIDTVTYDYKIVDNKGREINENYEPIIYDSFENMVYGDGIVVDEDNSYILPKSEPSKIVVPNNVVLKKTEKIYDNTIDRDVLLYENKSYRFLKQIKGTIKNNTIWKASSLKGNGGYIIFNNPKNNFNKMSGTVAMEYYEFKNVGYCVLKVYDADLYDKYNEYNRLDELKEIYTTSSLNEVDYENFNFTFDRSISRLRFEIETEEENKSITFYLKNLKYGFSKSVFRDELIRKAEEEEEIEELKRLGIYVEDYWNLDTLDEDGNNIEDDEDVENNEISLKSTEETKAYEDVIRDRKTGPSFDKDLNEKIDTQKIGPAFNNTE